jgi:tetratricopeptide (TPR) repeat protein
MNLGELRSHEGKTDQAHACFIEAGAAFWHKGNINAAIKMNKRALESKPDSRQAKTALALLQQEVDQAELPPPPPQPTPQAPRAKAAEVITGTLEEILISIPDEPGKPCVDESFQYGRSEPVFSPPPVVEIPLATSDSAVSPAQDGLLNGLSEDAIVEQIARAELLVAYGQADEGVQLLRETLLYRPDHIEIRAKLKDIYLRSGMIERASEECVNIAGIYAARGDSGRAKDHVTRARLLISPEPYSSPAELQAARLNNLEETADTNGSWTPDFTQPVTVM